MRDLTKSEDILEAKIEGLENRALVLEAGLKGIFVLLHQLGKVLREAEVKQASEDA